MNSKRFIRSVAAWSAGGIGLAAASYAAYVATAWLNYGKVKPALGEDTDALLDQFMPRYEVGARHAIHIKAPAQVAFWAATEADLESSDLIRGIFKGREWILRSKPAETPRPQGLLAQTRSLGWGILAETPGREIVMGCATRPWEANPVFRTLSADEFASFQEPGYVKIAWTLRADPTTSGTSVFRTETRVIATDWEARRKFRRYWAFLSPGILLIRAAMLPAVKREAEYRGRDIAA